MLHVFKRFILILLLLLFSNLMVFSQDLIVGVVKSKTDKAPIAFASISHINGVEGGLSNERGEFTINSVNDTLIVSAIGFANDTIFNILTSEINVIQLAPIEYALPVIEVSSAKSELIKVGVKKRKGQSIYSNYNNGNSEIGVQINTPNCTPDKKIKLNEVAFYISRNGTPQTPFRVKIYEFDPILNLPTKNILNANVICIPDKGGRWYKLNLSQYQIPISNETYVVVMEWLYEEGLEAYKNNNPRNKKNEFSSQSIGLTNHIDRSLTWRRSNERSWTNRNINIGGASTKKYLNASIYATFVVY